eukprot:3662160-Amphidinium_carterae.1
MMRWQEHQIQKHGNLVRFGRIDVTSDPVSCLNPRSSAPHTCNHRTLQQGCVGMVAPRFPLGWIHLTSFTLSQRAERDQSKQVVSQDGILCHCSGVVWLEEKDASAHAKPYIVLTQSFALTRRHGAHFKTKLQKEFVAVPFDAAGNRNMKQAVQDWNELPQ